jgi:hypothetical protein
MDPRSFIDAPDRFRIVGSALWTGRDHSSDQRVEEEIVMARLNMSLDSELDGANSNPEMEWGGGRHCQICRCRKHHYHTSMGEIWMFDWCYHEVEASEPVRLLASVFYMFNEPHPASA